MQTNLKTEITNPTSQPIILFLRITWVRLAENIPGRFPGTRLTQPRTKTKVYLKRGSRGVRRGWSVGRPLQRRGVGGEGGGAVCGPTKSGGGLHRMPRTRAGDVVLWRGAVLLEVLLGVRVLGKLVGAMVGLLGGRALGLAGGRAIGGGSEGGGWPLGTGPPLGGGIRAQAGPSLRAQVPVGQLHVCL